MARQHRFVQHMPQRIELHGKDFHNPGPTMERIVFWMSVGLGAAVGLGVIWGAVVR